MTHDSTYRIVRNIMNSFDELIGLWPTAEAFAQDLGISGQHARAMKRRNNIDQKYWVGVVEAAIKRGFSGVDYEVLARISAQKRNDNSTHAAQ